MKKGADLNVNLYNRFQDNTQGSTIYIASPYVYSVHGFAIICLLLYWTINIICWRINGCFLMRVIEKILQVSVSFLGIQTILKSYNQKIYRDLLYFDTAYFVTCLVNPNMFGNMKVFIHFFILQGVCFYAGYIGDRRTLRMIMKWIVRLSTFVAFFNNLFIIFPIGISGYNIGYIFGRNYGLFVNSSSMLGALHAITCIYLFYTGKYKEHKGFGIFLFIINYIALIANSTRGNYLIVAIGIGAISSLRLIRSFLYKISAERQLRFFVVTLLVGVITLGAGKYQSHIYFFFGSVFENETEMIANGIDAVLGSSSNGLSYTIINGGTKKILVSHSFVGRAHDTNVMKVQEVENKRKYKNNVAERRILITSKFSNKVPNDLYDVVKTIGVNAISDSIDVQMNRVLETRDVMDSGSMGIRVAMWKEALIAWRKNPILGVGRVNAGIYAQEVEATWMNTSNESSHNSWLNILLWSGIIGVFLFAKFVYDVIQFGKYGIRNKVFPIVIVLGFSLYMILYPGFIYTSGMLPLILWTSLGCMCRQEKENQ